MEQAAARIHYSEITTIVAEIALPTGGREACTVELVHTWCRGARRLTVALDHLSTRYSIDLTALGGWPEEQRSLLAGLEEGLRKGTLRAAAPPARIVGGGVAEVTLTWPLPSVNLPKRGEATFMLTAEA